ncbi:hypothetical protein KAT80_03460 [Candidatus Pacearchaeota archaeon]|nr:hypothetical protein [Candidatus Pacearchaeota archaeon]
MEKENKLEKTSRNKINNINNIFLFSGAIAESIAPGVAIPASLVSGFLFTNLSKPVYDKLNGYKTPLKEMFHYSAKNSVRCLMGATTVSALRYLF